MKKYNYFSWREEFYKLYELKGYNFEYSKKQLLEAHKDYSPQDYLDFRQELWDSFPTDFDLTEYLCDEYDDDCL